MASDWPVTSLEEAGVRLIDCLHSTPASSDVGYPYVAIPQMKEGRIEVDDARRITAAAFREWTAKANPIAHDVLLSRRCNPGTTAYVQPGLRFAVGQNLVLLRADGTRVHPPFLRWWVSGPDWWNEVRRFLNVGAVFDSLRCRDVPKFELPLPPLDEQRRIATVLGALDDKIELNRKMNRTLEEMAQALFKSWFIDFDGHDDLVDSEIGPVPRGWEVGGPDALVEFDPTIPLRKGTEAVYADMKAIPTSGPAVSESTRRAYVGGTRFQQGDTLLARITPCLENGKSALVDFLADGEVAFGSTEFIVLRPRPSVPRVWPYCLVRHEPFRAHAIANMTGSSGRQRVSAGALLGFRIAVPPVEILRCFGAVSDPLFERITANTRESTTLAALRDTLLPKLISGEVRVGDVEGLADEEGGIHG